VASIRPIHTLLVANRGEIALRIIDAAKDLGLSTVAVYAEPDRRAPFVREADVAVPLGGTESAATYLDQAKLLDATLATGADAVHPGYGFLSENADFAQAVIDAGLTWVGPRPDAIRAMGDKLAAKRIAAKVGVPTLPSAELTGDAEFEWRAQTAAVGYPLMVKAAAGGGGRGMRLVGSEDELAEAVRSARREAEASFGDPTVFAERWLAAPRHVEVQLVADQHGNVIHLGERECSIQRRHQKLIEESPSPVVDPVRREQLGAAAIELARAIDYDNVGTVEFLLDADRGEFYFLEMNTRIQVEHRVTEEAVGGDMVWWQIQCARGEPLEWTQEDVDLTDRHAVEVRLYAEDPSRDWLPTFGTIDRFENDEYHDDHITVDSAITSSDLDVPVAYEVSPQFDGLLAKITAGGYTRVTAVKRLVRYLTELELHGVTTNRDYLLAVLTHPDFLEGATTTLFVADHPALLEAGPDADTIARHAIATLLWSEASSTARAVWPFAEVGWRNVGGSTRSLELGHRDRELRVTVTGSADGRFDADVDGLAVAGRVLDRNRREIVLEIDGLARRYSCRHRDQTWYVNSSLGQTDLVERPRFAEPRAAGLEGGPTAPVPGRIAAISVTVGEAVSAGQTLVVLEAMKVEHQVRAVAAGVVSDILVAVDETVEAHQLLIRLADEP
jgi:propionyl-CoA carboxylase alpha chain